MYDDGRKWSAIYQANVERIGSDPNLIQIGDRFRIPCLDASIASETEQLSSTDGTNAELQLLTADDYRPFTHRGLLNDGLVTHIVDRSMALNAEVSDYGIVWVNDWSTHLDPLLSGQTYDLGFPWLRPDCTSTPDERRCQEFIFSEPMFEMLVLLFVNADRSFTFAEDTDIFGKTLCRPAGYYTHDLDKNGRNWLKEGRVMLEQPASVNDCFDLLLAGDVDAVALNEFTGRSAMAEMGLETEVRIIETRPLSIEGLHVIAHRDHPEGFEMIEQLNAGLEALKRTGEYNEIVDQHLAIFWTQFDS